METTSTDSSQGRALRRFGALLRRRWWLVLLPAVVLTGLAIARTATQETLYEGQADVLLSRRDLASVLQGSPTNTSVQPAEFFQIAQTQSNLAHTPQVAEAVLRELDNGTLSVEDLLNNTTVSPRRGTDLLSFAVRNGDRALAQTLASEFARQYTIYRRELDTTSLENARRGITQKLAALDRGDPADKAVYDSLSANAERLRTLQALQSTNAQLVRTQLEAEQVSPRPKRDIALALILGTILGVGLAALRDLLDNRVRSLDEVSEALDMSPLGFLPPPPVARAGTSTLLMRDDPNAPAAEGFRVVAQQLQLANLGIGAKLIAVTSAVESEGKTTTISNLGLTLARSGKSVALVDLDFRRPRIGAAFGVVSAKGITDIALGTANVQDAACEAFRSEDGDGHLDIFVTGPKPPSPGEFVGSEPVARFLAELSKRYDFVLVDAPPCLRVGDPLSIAPLVDAVFIVVRLGVVSRPILRELGRVVDNLHAPKLGFIATGAPDKATGYGYGYGYYGYDDPDEPAGGSNGSTAIAHPAGAVASKTE